MTALARSTMFCRKALTVAMHVISLVPREIDEDAFLMQVCLVGLTSQVLAMPERL